MEPAGFRASLNKSFGMIDDIDEAEVDHQQKQSSISISRRIRNKSMDQSKSIAEITKLRQKSLNMGKNGDKNRKRMLSINPIADKNSLVDLNIEEMEIVERREKLIMLAKIRQRKQTQANNLMKAA